MLRAISEIAAATTVTSLPVKPICIASSRAACLAATTSAPERIGRRVTSSKALSGPLFHALLICRGIMRVRVSRQWPAKHSPAFQCEGLPPGVQTRHECSIDLMLKYFPREGGLRHGVVSHLELGTPKRGLSGEMIVARIAGCALLLSLSMVPC